MTPGDLVMIKEIELPLKENSRFTTTRFPGRKTLQILFNAKSKPWFNMHGNLIYQGSV